MGWLFAKRSSWGGRWLPLLLAMSAIFVVSHQPSVDLPNFGLWDLGLKKGGHFLAYAGLALLALRATLEWQRPYLAALIIVFLFALSDEYHQTFIPGRSGTLVDVAIDMFGAATCLFFLRWWQLAPIPQSQTSLETS